jgi:transcription initiation factor TFIID subunit TAF12
MRPSIQSNVLLHQEQQKHGHDQRAKERDFKPGDPVYVRNMAQGATWLPGTIVEVRGPVSYTVSLEDGRLVRRHVDHLRSRELSDANPSNTTVPNWDNTLPASPSAEAESSPTPAGGADNSQRGDTTSGSGLSQTPLRRSSRTHRPPDRY